MSKAQASIEITASSSRLAAGLNAARAKFQNFAGNVARGIGATFKGINKALAPGETAKRALGNFGGDMITRGVDAFTDAAGAVRDYERNLTRVRIQAGQTAEWQQELSKSIRKTSSDTGVASAELAQAAGIYFDLTSDAKGMTKALDTFGKVAEASGANMEDIVRAAAAMQDNMGIGADEMEAAFSGLIQQGKAGKISLKDMGAEFPSLLAMFSKFGQGKRGMFELGAAFQVGAKAFGSANEAATGLEAMMGMLQARQSQLKSIAGVDVYKKGTNQLKGLAEIVDQIRKKNIDPRKWKAIFGENKEGRNFLEMLLKFPKLYDDINAAANDAGAVQRDALAFAESDAGRLDLAMNRIKETIAKAFTPERITAFTNAVIALAEKLGPVVDGVGKIADKLGGIYDVGRKVRGFLSSNENGNPFARDALERARLENTANGTGAWVRDSRGKWIKRDSKEGQREVEIAKRELANASGYDSTVSGILGNERNERTTKESIEAAIGAYYSGNLGASDAGRKYLRAAGFGGAGGGVDEARIQEIIKKSMQDASLEFAKGLKDSLGGLTNMIPDIRVGDNAVAAGVANATKPRRGAK